ncbi:MAG: DEAD/DEAH box helicase, partial [Nitrospinota bacterium]
PGIKAIIIYPMNALATDQAGRLASLIWNSKLKGNVTAGLYVGQNEKDMQRVMGADSLISNKEALRQSPPDILLTNYKMLDYLLVRPVDKPLWSQNKSETLRFLVVDELHSFDGAQGSDLGCLVRRLKSRLGTPENHLCCVGTSATLGEGDKKNALQEYAETLLGESFDKDALIKEARLSAGDFLDKSFIKRIDIVPLEKSEDLNPDNYKGYKEYVSAQHKLWFDEDLEGEFSEQKWGFDLCDKIKEHLLFQNLLKTLAGKTAGFDDILAKLDKTSEDFSKGDTSYKVNLLNSLLSLVSEARLESGRPFLNVRLQVWLRELRRMVCDVGKTPALKFAADLSEEQLEAHLPLVHCRECGSMGWAGLKRKNSTSVGVKLQDFYHAFFKHDPKVVFIFPEENTVHVQEPNVGHQYLCPDCLNVTVQEKPGACPSCDGKNSLPVFMPDARRKRGRKLISVNDCPHCESANSLSIVGSRAASLTSVMIAQLYSSNFNDDKKLLTFSDNVQDAAHRTGFFNARTYRFTFRTCLQQVVMNTEKSYTLADLSNLFIDYWSEKMDKNRYLATFLGPNMEWFSDFEHLKTHGSLPPDSTLKSLVDKRIGWEIMSEYGFRARIGRTLEKTTSSVAFLDPTKVKECVNEVLEIIQNEFEAMREISPALVHRFILGFVVHLKNQGGIFHSALAAYIEGFGNTYKINTTNWMPGFGVFSRTPAFLTTRKNERFDQLLGMSATRRTWYQGWVEKCFYTFNPLVLAESGKIYEVVLGGMVKSGLLFERVIKKDPVWGLKPEAFRISLKVLQLRCVRCGHSLSVAEEEKEAFLEAPCQRFRCHGIYKPAVSEIADYYGKLYQTGDVERIFSEEHTGLLERKPREDLERQFKSSARERQPWYPNLLSCTPTLEMGIDIGDLSSLILCSVPPAQSNYVQRIGRAGRRDGNGLNITVANGRPHDLYFYAEPEEMLAGHMDPPGVFINASAVLERQFTAFCFDRWIAPEEDTHIPAWLGEVLNNLESHNSNKFPYHLVPVKREVQIRDL